VNEFVTNSDNRADLSPNQPIQQVADKVFAAGRDVQSAAVDLANSASRRRSRSKRASAPTM
jgi:hypothetical protein